MYYIYIGQLVLSRDMDRKNGQTSYDVHCSTMVRSVIVMNHKYSEVIHYYYILTHHMFIILFLIIFGHIFAHDL